MPTNSFSLFATAKNVTQMLRAKLQSAPAEAAELNAALEEIQTLWEELQTQSDVLKDERQRHADFFEFAPEAYMITEPAGEIREANRAARELLGMAEEEIDGASLVAFVKDEERPAFRGRLITARGHPEGAAAEWTTTLVSRTGAQTPVALCTRPIKVRRKNADGLCWLIRPSRGDGSEPA